MASSRSFTVSVPGTLSNLGPGYDVLGLAVSMRSHFGFSRAEGWWAEGRALDPHSHLTLATALAAGERFDRPLNGLAVVQTEAVPRSRGLGSSATARVAGLLAWRRLSGVTPPVEEQLAFLAEGEGHPDNVVPALLGGLTVCAQGPSGLQHMRLEPPEGLRVALCVPELEVSTEAARGLLPVEVPHKDAVFNGSRLAFLMAGLLTGRPEVLSLGVEDRLHQPWRKGLIGPVDAALAAAQRAGAAGAFISGSGSTLAAWVPSGASPEAVARAMAAVFEGAGIPAAALVVDPSGLGASYEA